MIRFIKNSTIILLVLLFSCTQKGKEENNEGLPFINKPDYTPEWISKKDPAYASIHRIPAFSFTDQDGNTVTEKTVEGKIYVADFFFTRCGSICPVMTRNLATVQEAFRDNNEVMILSHSVLPEMDSVPVLKEYAQDHGIVSGKWHLLTGDKEKIYSLARQQYYAGDTIGYYKTVDDFLHTENVMLLDKHRRIRGIYNGTLQLEMERLTGDIHELLKEE